MWCDAGFFCLVFWGGFPPSNGLNVFRTLVCLLFSSLTANYTDPATYTTHSTDVVEGNRQKENAIAGDSSDLSRLFFASLLLNPPLVTADKQPSSL